MALLDLSLVTKTLVNLLREYLLASPVGPWDSLTHPPITQRPPDKVTEENTLCIYLFHVSEDTQYKNLPAPGNDTPPIRYVPMGLNLYYQLSAHSPYGAEDDYDQPQLMMGIALKAFHDHPIISDSTQINGEDILEDDLRGSGNKLRITLHPVPHNEAVNVWNNGSTAPRLSAYYQVSVVLLEPDETASRAGRVLEYGVHTFIQGAPRLTGSRNTLEFTAPDGTPRKLELQPAQVPVGSRVSFTGTGLTGDSISLLLKNNRWDDPEPVDPAWVISTREDNVVVETGETVGAQDVLPGIYSFLAEVARTRTLSDGTQREFKHMSNECPFTVSPRIDAVSPPVANIVTVDGYIFQHLELKDGAVRVYLGENRLTLDTGGPFSPGEFQIVNPLQLRFMLPDDLDPGFYPVRIFVNGAESPPRWVEVP